MSTITLAHDFKPYVDEVFKNESKKTIVTNNDFTFTGAHTVSIYKVTTAPMTDYDRAGTGTGTTGSRYGAVAGIDATTEEFVLKRDRSFTFAIDKLDKDETKQQLAGASALARQIREVVIPEVDSYTYKIMTEKAGFKPAAVALTADNILDEIFKANEALDDAEAPEAGRALIVTPTTYKLIKASKGVILNTDIAEEMRLKGVVAMIDGATVIKVPSVRLPQKFGFMLCHNVATCAPVKLDDYKVHSDPPGISGDLVEGRIVYDAFVLDNKTKAIYYQAIE